MSDEGDDGDGPLGTKGRARAKRGPGRPGLRGGSQPGTWTLDRVERVAKRHASGTWLKHACALEGGTYHGLYEAMDREPAFRELIDRAHAQRADELRALKASAMPGEDDWKKWAWDLERWDREAFAPPTNKVDAAVKVEPLSPETAALVAAVVAGKDGE